MYTCTTQTILLILITQNTNWSRKKSSQCNECKPDNNGYLEHLSRTGLKCLHTYTNLHRHACSHKTIRYSLFNTSGILPVCCCILLKCESSISVYFVYLLFRWYPHFPLNEIKKYLSCSLTQMHTFLKMLEVTVPKANVLFEWIPDVGSKVREGAKTTRLDFVLLDFEHADFGRRVRCMRWSVDTAVQRGPEPLITLKHMQMQATLYLRWLFWCMVW